MDQMQVVTVSMWKVLPLLGHFNKCTWFRMATADTCNSPVSDSVVLYGKNAKNPRNFAKSRRVRRMEANRIFSS